MLTTLTRQTWTDAAACTSGRAAAVFHNPLLDYDPIDHDFLEPTLITDDGPVSLTASQAVREQQRLTVAAKAVCASCPVFSECLTWAMSSDVEGVAAGLTGAEAANVRRALQVNVTVLDTQLYGDLPPESAADIDPFEVAGLLQAGVPVRDLMRRYGVSDRTVTRKRQEAERLTREGRTTLSADDRDRANRVDVVSASAAASAAHDVAQSFAHAAALLVNNGSHRPAIGTAHEQGQGLAGSTVAVLDVEEALMSVGRQPGSGHLWQFLADGQAHSLDDAQLAVCAGGGARSDANRMLAAAITGGYVRVSDDGVMLVEHPAPLTVESVNGTGDDDAPLTPLEVYSPAGSCPPVVEVGGDATTLGGGTRPKRVRRDSGKRRAGTVSYHRKSGWMQAVWRLLADGNWWDVDTMVAIALEHGCQDRGKALNAITASVRTHRTLERDGARLRATDTALNSLPVELRVGSGA